MGSGRELENLYVCFILLPLLCTECPPLLWGSSSGCFGIYLLGPKHFSVWYRWFEVIFLDAHYRQQENRTECILFLSSAFHVCMVPCVKVVLWWNQNKFMGRNVRAKSLASVSSTPMCGCLVHWKSSNTQLTIGISLYWRSTVGSRLALY